MLVRKARRMLAGLCVALMLSQSVGESALTVVAAESGAEAAAEEGFLEEDGAADGAVSGGDVKGALTEADDESAGIALYSDTNANLPSQDGEDVSWGIGVKVTKEGDDFVIRYTTVVGNVEVVGRMNSNGVLTIDKGLNMIRAGLFAERAEITELRFEKGAIVKAVDDDSFKKCINLRRVDFSNCPALAQIGLRAFENCSSLEEVKFHDNLQIIYKYAFANCALTSVTLGPGLTGLDDYAFSGCKSLERVRVETPNSVCDGAGYIFQNCNIKEIDFAIRNVTGDNSQKNIIVPSSMFKGATFAEDADILIPCEIQEVGVSAFEGSNLSKVTFENTPDKPSMLSTISKNAFKSTKITSITFPDTVQTLGESSFESCAGLTELVLPNSITTLDKRAFRECRNISELKLPNATTTIGEYAFENCVALTEVELPEGLEFTGKGEFKGCTNLSSVSIPDTIKEIGDETFMQCILLTEMVLPESVTKLGKSSFEGCLLLKTVQYSKNLTEINDKAFKNALLLTSNVFPETLTVIGESAFENCKYFEDLTIPVNVTTIGKRAFANCTGINNLTIKSNEIVICGDEIFDECLLRTVQFPEGITTIPGHLFNQANFTPDTEITIPNTVTTIGDYAFAGDNYDQANVPKIVFEAGSKLTTIGAHAFEYCTALESFTIPETTEKIGDYAFANCYKISSIVIPENVTEIGTGAFSNCSILSEITYNAIHVTTNKQNIFAKCNVKKITIGEKVEAFPAYLFYGAQFSKNDVTGEEELVTIYIPASVEEIGDYALPNIANLQHVVFKDGSMVTRIGNYAFSQCKNLESINLPDSVTSIGNHAFEGCSKLGSDSAKPFNIPASLVTLGDNAFKDCPSLTGAVIPEGVTKINNAAFQNDTGLAAVQMVGGALTEIGVSSFEGCTALTKVSIPNGVTKIGATAFKNCSALTEVKIPATVTSIGKDAFAGCGSKVQFLVVPGSYAADWLDEQGIEYSKLKTITYVLNGGVNAPQNDSGYEPGDTFLFTPATRKGYAFKGWYMDENFQTEITGVEGCTEDITIYAKWEIDTYTITYVLDGGVNHKDNPATYTILDRVDLKNPTKEGFTFDGWYNDPENPKSKVTVIATGNSGDRTLYAKWNGGTAEAPVANIESGSVVKKGTKIFLTSKTPGVRICYTLDGTEPTKDSTSYTGGIVVDQDLTVKAVAVKSNGVLSEVAVFTYSIIDEATFWGDIPPEDRTEYGSATEVPEGIWVAGVKDVVYSGQKVTFDLRVYDHKTLLKEKTDYTVKYANNVNVATKKKPTVTITAKGNYKGKVVKEFNIEQLKIDGEDFSAEDMVINVTGKPQKPVPVLYYGKKKLKNKKDYSVEYFKVAENGSETMVSGCDTAGKYRVKLTGQGNFAGERTVNVTLEAGTSVAKAKITGLAAYDYNNGEAIIPEFTVKVGADILTKGTDYEVICSNNVNAGTATVMIRGKGSYCGTKKATFKIKPIATLNKVSFTLDKTKVSYTGIPYEVGKGIDVTANYNGKPLVKDVDYTCSYKKNTDAGTATVTFTGIGGYSGTTKKTFKIEGADITILPINFLDSEGEVMEDDSVPTYAFEQGGVKPSVQIVCNGKILVAGTDYTLSYKNNAARTNGNNTADITIKGKKNYKGTVSRKFKIDQQDISKLSVDATDVVYQKKAGVLESSKVTVTDVNGKTLVKDTDYRISGYSYYNDTTLADKDGTLRKEKTPVKLQEDIIPAETIIVVNIMGAGNYKGNTTTYIRVCKKGIASMKVTVKPQTYTGSEIQPGKDQMTVKGEGQFEIVGYTNNIKKGTAKVTLRGVGDYGGTKVVTFKIVQKPFDVMKWLQKLF